MYVLGFVLGLEIMKRIFKKDGIPLDKLDPLFLYTILAMLIGARVGHYVFYEENYTLAEVFLPFKLNPFEYTGFQGLASHGATIGIMLAMYFYSKRVVKKPLLWTFDRMAIVSALVAGLVRLGNLFNSEIIGKPTNSDFGFKFIRDHISPNRAMQITKSNDVEKAYDLIANSSRFKEVLAEVPNRHPTQLYEALGYFVIFIVLWYLYRKTDKKNKLGYLFGVLMVMLWSVRFFVEFFKEAQVDGREDWVFDALNTGQVLSIPLIALGLYFMFRNSKKEA